MKKILLKIALFSLPVAVIIIFMEICVRTYPSMYETKKAQLMLAADSVETLILGNSSAMDGIDPTQINEYAFNFAFAAQPLFFDIKLTEKYLHELPRVKHIVISTIFASFFHEGSRSFYYHKYFGINYKNEHYWKEDMLQSFFVLDSDQLRHIIAHTFYNRPKFDLLKGWSSFHNTDYQSVESDEKAKLRANFFNAVCADYKGGDAVFNELDEFLFWLVEQNIVPILVSMPYHPNVRKYLDHRIESSNTARLTFLAEKYNIPFLDLYADSDFITDDFHNFDHLNSQGAAKLGRKINEVLLSNSETSISKKIF